MSVYTCTHNEPAVWVGGDGGQVEQREINLCAECLIPWYNSYRLAKADHGVSCDECGVASVKTDGDEFELREIHELMEKFEPYGVKCKACGHSWKTQDAGVAYCQACSSLDISADVREVCGTCHYLEVYEHAPVSNRCDEFEGYVLDLNYENHCGKWFAACRFRWFRDIDRPRACIYGENETHV